MRGTKEVFQKETEDLREDGILKLNSKEDVFCG